LVVTIACGCHDLPDDQRLTSPHFRYHARADAVLDPTIMDRLEAHRAEFDGAYGVDPGVVDYYLFRDAADLDANSPCPPDSSCTDGRSVMADAPFHEHELVHAFLADTGLPAPVVAEGFAQYASCIYARFAYAIPPEQWQTAIETTSLAYASVYDFGQRLVSWMMAAGGTARTLDFYHRAASTNDAALFTLQFERFWGRRLSDVAVELQDDRYGGSTCPCTAPALPADGSPSSFVALEDYRTVEVAQASRLELTSDRGQLVFPYDCANAPDGFLQLPPQGEPPVSPSLTIARVGPGRFGVTAAWWSDDATAVVHQSQRVTDDWSRATAVANPVPLDGRAITAWVAPGPAEPTWFAFSVDGPTELEVLDPETSFLLCPSCGLGFGDCGSASLFQTTPIPLPRPASGTICLALIGSPSMKQGATLRPAP
jgi:hypothetical protein